MSIAYSHVWRTAKMDFPCNPTGLKGPSSNGQIYVQIAYEDNRTYVPQEQLVTYESWKAEQPKAAAKTPRRPASLESPATTRTAIPSAEGTPMDAAEQRQAGQAENLASIAVTWASTPSQERLGKIWKPECEGEWPVTDGVKHKSYVFEHPHYPDFEAFAAGLGNRLRAGAYAMVAGRPKNLREGDPPRTRRRTGKNFSDLPCRLLVLDFDGLAPVSPGKRLDRPEDFGDAVLAEIRQRLPPAFKSVDCLLVATSSTGLPVNAKGKPANGCARFRAIFLLSRPLFFAAQKQIVIALKKLPGLDCLDLAIYSVPQFSFIARPIFPPGMDDPIAKPVIPCKGGQSQIDVDLLTEIDVEPASPMGRRTDGTPVRAEDRRLSVAPGLRVPLVSQAVEAIVNDLDRVDWVHMAHAIDGSVDGDPEGRNIFLEFSARWEGEADPYEDFDQVGEADQPAGWEEPDPEEEAERVWDTRGEEGRAGFGYLMQLLGNRRQTRPRPRSTRSSWRGRKKRLKTRLTTCPIMMTPSRRRHAIHGHA